MADYQIFKNGTTREALGKPIKETVTELLTSRAQGCSLEAIVEPRTDAEKLLTEGRRLFTRQLALNYGHNGGSSFMFYVVLLSQKRFDTRDGPVYVLDNAVEDNKAFLTYPNRGFNIWHDGDKVRRTLMLEGDISEVFKELEGAGYSFSTEEAFQHTGNRTELVVARLKELKIYHALLNPQPQ